MRRFCFSICLMLLPWGAARAQVDQKVLFIGIDGCRPDALTFASTPNIDVLIANSTYSLDAMNGGITWSGPGWSNLLCGVREDKHGVTDNFFFGANYTDYPHFFNRIEEYDPSMVTASFTTWWPLDLIILDLVDVKYALEYSLGGDAIVSDSLVGYLGSGDPDVIFMYFGDVDAAGHAYGFDPNVPEYISALETTDDHIGKLLSAIDNRSNIVNENWLIIVSTDHGGIGLGHGGTSFVEENIFVIVSGDAVPNQVIIRNSVFDPDSGFFVDDFSNTPRQVDVMPTILEFLCVPIQPSWGLEGTSLLTPCLVVGVEEPGVSDKLLMVYPNPGSGSFYVKMNLDGESMLTLTDGMGRGFPINYNISDEGFEIQVGNLPNGVYTLLINGNERMLRKNIIVLR